MNEPTQPELAELAIADPQPDWEALGFLVDEDGNLDVGGVRVRLGIDPDGDGRRGIVSWSLRGVNAMGSIDGLASPVPRVLRPPPFATHPNGVTGIDHVVIVTPDFGRTAGALQSAGMPLRRAVTAGGGVRQGFRRVGPAIVELVHSPQNGVADVHFWGLTFVVVSPEALAERLGEHLSEVRPAVQPGRRIATLRASAGLSPAVAFISPEP